jgi:hypothetical protein
MCKITPHIFAPLRVLLVAKQVNAFVIVVSRGIEPLPCFFPQPLATAAPPNTTDHGSSMRSLSAAAAPSRSCVVVAAFQSRPVGVCCSHRVVVARPTPSSSPLLR